MSKELDETLKNIITVSANTSLLYQNLADAKYKEEEQEIKKQLEYIKMTLDYENQLYEKIDLKKELGHGPRLHNRFDYLLMNSDIPKEIHDLISLRFKEHINELLIRNPFLSNSAFTEVRQIENENAIMFQANRDMAITTLYYLNRDTNREKKKKVKKDLLTFYYESIFKQRIVEEFLATPPQKIEANGRDRCLAFGQDNNLVNNIYQSMIMDTIGISANQVIQYTNDYLKKHPQSISGQKFSLSVIKAAISLATPEEQDMIDITINPYFENISSQSYNNLIEAIEEATTISRKKTTQKKKSRKTSS